MNRRGFIGGMVAALSGGSEALIRLANPSEQSFIRVGDAAMVVAPHSLKPMDIPRGSAGQFYLAVIGPNGVKHEIFGMARDLSFESSVDSIDVTRFVGSVTHVAGPRSTEVRLAWPTDMDRDQVILKAWS